jgi:thioredoxin-dependent peroxiredoxin
MKLLKTLSTACTVLALGVVAHADPLQVGAAAPQASGVDQDGKAIDLKDFYAKGPTLVYFYPKADTPGCTKEGCSLRDNWKALQDKGIQVVGVSEDTTDEEKAFHEKFHFPFPLLADHDGKVATAFGVPLNNGHAKRQSFLIKDGKVAWNMLDKTTTETHGTDVLKAYDGLAK